MEEVAMKRRLRNKINYAKGKIFALEYLGGRCNNCFGVFSLEFDHIDPMKKEFEVTSLMRGNREKLKKELDKCQLLCTPCHLEKTSRQFYLKVKRKPLVHGRLNSYVNWGCRCEPCSTVNKISCKERRNKKLTK